MTKYRLNSAETVPITINMVARTKEINGKSVVTYNNYIRLAPNTEYKDNDEAMLNFLENYTIKVRYNSELEKALKEHDIPYEVEFCKSCGGKVKKISYHPVEVLR